MIVLQGRSDDALLPPPALTLPLKRLHFPIPRDEANRLLDTTCTFERCTRVFTLEK